MGISSFVNDIGVIAGFLGIIFFGFDYKEFSKPQKIMVFFLMGIFLIVLSLSGLVNN